MGIRQSIRLSYELKTGSNKLVSTSLGRTPQCDFPSVWYVSSVWYELKTGSTEKMLVYEKRIDPPFFL